jgi:hypothetical protein
MGDEQPWSQRALVDVTGLSPKAIGNALSRLWKSQTVLRTGTPQYIATTTFKGRAGYVKHTCGFHLYLHLPLTQMSKITIQGIWFVRYSEEAALAGQGARVNKSALIREFLQQHADQAFYSTEICDALMDQGVAQQDVMATVRRAEQKRLVYVRGYRTHDRQTPFPQGYLITWIDDTVPRKHALYEAVERTNQALAHAVSMSPAIQRNHRIHDTVIESTKLRDLASFDFLQNALRCTKHETTGALERTLQLYPEIQAS